MHLVEHLLLCTGLRRPRRQLPCQSFKCHIAEKVEVLPVACRQVTHMSTQVGGRASDVLLQHGAKMGCGRSRLQC